MTVEPAPSGCGWCDHPQRGHDDQFVLYAADRHPYQAPTQRQILTRMKERRTQHTNPSKENEA